MPRSRLYPDNFIAGKLPEVAHNGKQYYVDGRMKCLRNVTDYSDSIILDDLEIVAMSEQCRSTVIFEFYGV